VSSEISLDSLLQRNDDLLIQKIDDDLVMADLKAGAYFGLADVSKSIWDHLGSSMTAGALCDALQLAYEVDRQTCEADVLAFLRDMQAEGLIRRIG
jgi:hypothetical protein